MMAPIIIAGAGPVGSTLALALGRAGLPVLLLEKEPDLPVDLRASTFHPPSLDMLDELGVAKQMIAQGLVVDRYQYRDRKTGEIAEFDMSIISDETRHPFRLQLEQYELTRIIATKLSQMTHVNLILGAHVSNVSQNEDGVDVTVNGEIVRGSYLIGADGAASSVRKAVGIGYGGFTYDEKFLVVSTPYPFESVFERLAWVNYVSDPDEWCVLLRTEKVWRILWPTEPGISDAVYLSDAHIRARLIALHRGAADQPILHRTLYNVHQRVAETYVRERIILVGDAAHINNPLGGMGMNGGLHDAINLAEKLVAIEERGEDRVSLLTLYDRQRRQTATAFVQKHTIDNKKMMEARDPNAQATRQAFLMAAAADPLKAKSFVSERAMIECVRASYAIQ